MRSINYTFYLFGWAVICSLNCHSQSLYDPRYLENPNLPGSFLAPFTDLEKLQAEKLTRSTADFQLLGNVKTIKQTIYYQELDKPPKHSEYQFLTNKKLLSYVEDTAKVFINSNAVIENYTYSKTDSSLIKIVYQNGAAGVNSKRTLFFNNRGLASREIFEQFQKKDWTYEEFKKNIFDYELVYTWNKKADSVALKYTYKTDATHYVRHTDHSFAFEGNNKRINATNLKDQEVPAVLKIDPTLAIERRAIKDSTGRIIEYYIYDHAIKGSYNIHQKYIFEYDTQNRPTDSRLYTMGLQPEWQLKQHYLTVYLEFDSAGNWLRKKVTSNVMNETEIMYYDRVITYY